MSIAADAVEGLFNLTKGDTASIAETAMKSTTSEWQSAQTVKATAIGGAAAAIPIAGYLTIPADLAALFRIMHRSAVGTCAIEFQYVDDSHFAGVLGVWSGGIVLDDSLQEQMIAKMLAKKGAMLGGHLGLKMAVEAFNISAQAILAKKLGPKVAAKVATKMTAKLGAKVSTRWIPVVSALVGGSANLLIVRSMNSAATRYTEFIKETNEKAQRSAA